MAITFFSINGAGSGGGSSTVHTNNGISGDGSVATPVILGGNPLTADTTITGAGHFLNIITDDSIKRSEIDIAANSSFLGTTVDATGHSADIETLFSGGVLSLFMELQSGSNVKHIEMSEGGGGVGINVADSVDNIGLIGDVLFPLTAGANQYVQAGHLPAGFAGAENGTEVLVSGKVGLGGHLTQTTTIDTTGFEMIIGDPTQTGPNIDIDTPINSLVLMQGFGAGTVNAVMNLGSNQASLEVLNSHIPGYDVKINVTQSSGIQVTDSANIGLTGPVFPVSGNPGQYVQFGNIASPLTSFNKFIGETSTLVGPLGTPTANVMVRVNVTVIFTTFFASDSLAVSIDYTDSLGNSRNAVLGTVNSVVPSSFPSINLLCHSGNAINLSVISTLVGGSVYNAYGNVEIIGNL